MSITFPCVCGKELTVPDEAAGSPFKCRWCGMLVTVPAADAHPSDWTPPAETRSCPRCRQTVPARPPFCAVCGWDAETNRLCCPTCRQPYIVARPDYLTVLPNTALVAIAFGLELFFEVFTRPMTAAFGAAAAVCGLFGVNAFVGAFRPHLRCPKCEAEAQIPDPTPEQRGEMLAQRGRLIGWAAAWFALSAVFAYELVALHEALA